MDNRQTKITEGAGLEESRINKEFVDFVQKWSTPVLLLILVIAGAYAGSIWLKNQRVKNTDAAFLAFQEAEAEGRPEKLLDVASKHGGYGSIRQMATLTAADLKLEAAYLRIKPGTLGIAPEDRLDDAQAAAALSEAGDLYATVFREAQGKKGRELQAIGARWGMAAVDLSKRRFDAAETALQEVLAIAQNAGYTDLAENAAALIAKLPALRDQPVPVAQAPAATTPETPPAPADTSEPDG